MGPLSHSYAAAGFFPKSNQLLPVDEQQQQRQQQQQDSDLEGSVYNQSKYWLIEDNSEQKLNRQFLRCIQTANLRSNFLYWDEKSKLKQQQAIAAQSTLEEDESETK